MKVSDVEWQWDRHQLTVYFTAEQRVDFRALVRELASAFRTRIELRQIGVRDEAARLGGVGRCGREYCCSTWLPELSPGQPLARQGPAASRSTRRRSPAGADACSAASSTSTSSTSRRASASPARARPVDDAARRGEGDRGRHLPRARLPAGRRRGAHASVSRSSARRWSRRGRRCGRARRGTGKAALSRVPSRGPAAGADGRDHAPSVPDARTPSAPSAPSGPGSERPARPDDAARGPRGSVAGAGGGIPHRRRSVGRRRRRRGGGGGADGERTRTRRRRGTE